MESKNLLLGRVFVVVSLFLCFLIVILELWTVRKTTGIKSLSLQREIQGV